MSNKVYKNIYAVGKSVLHSFLQPLTPNLHPAEGEPFLAQVLQRGSEMMDRVVDAEEALVGVSEKPLFFLY